MERFFIHKEGYALVFLTLVAWSVITTSLSIQAPDWLFWPLFGILTVAMILVLQFFRNPSRSIPKKDDSLVYAPADGKIVVIEKVQADEYFEGEKIQVSIFMSPLNVHVNRYPFAGEVVYTRYHEGKYLVAWDPKSSTENERNCLVLRNPKGVEVLIKQIAGAVARRIISYAQVGQKVQQGADQGFIRFGSRVDLLLPLDAEILCEIGQKAVGNQTVIAKLP
jgi:phosphatidylserine decarboxylase